MRKYLGFIFLLSMSGCAPMMKSNLLEFRGDNRRNIQKIDLGMTKNEVIQIMGNEIGKTEEWMGCLYGGYVVTESVNNPYSSEILQGKDKKFSVLYYYTDLKRGDGAITDDELTPIVFEDGKVIGWGRGFLEDNINKYEIRVR